MKPYEVEVLVGEVADDHGHNELYHVLFDGSVNDEHGCVAIGGHAEELGTALEAAYREGWDLATAVRHAVEAISGAEQRRVEPTSVEAGVLDRTRSSRRKFRRLEEDEIARILSA
jgi:proteasome alpha subunit